MVRFNFKKVAASVAALSIVACMAAVPTSASDTVVEIEIGNKTLTVSEAKANPVVDIPITLDTPKLTGFQISFEVPDAGEGGRLKRELEYTNPLLAVAEISQPDNVTGIGSAWAASKTSPKDLTGEMGVFHITLPDDVKAGDRFEINYLPVSPNKIVAEWNDVSTQTRYGDSTDTYSYVNGWIEIVEDEVATTTTPAATTTTPAATTTTEAPVGTTTEAPATTTAATTADAGNASNTTGASTGAGAGGTGTTVTTVAGGTTSASSPQTGSSDVLPIAGAAAAVAVLGGVALVAKKKND